MEKDIIKRERPVLKPKHCLRNITFNHNGAWGCYLDAYCSLQHG